MSPLKPVFLVLAVAAAAVVMPALKLMDYLSRGGGGDGLQNFWPGVFIFGGCAVVTLVAGVAGLRRGEKPAWLAPAAIALWLLPLLLLAM
jgi:hypothetical protein